MAREATVGFMVWDGKSMGTLLNVFRLLRQQKKAVVYDVAEQKFYELKENGQWEDFISKCGGELRNRVEQRATLEEHEHSFPPPQSSKRRRLGRRGHDDAPNVPLT